MTEQQTQDIIMRISEDVAILKSEVKSTWKRIDEQHSLVDSVHKLALSIEKQSIILERHTESIEDIERKVEAIEAKPAKRWEGVLTQVIAVIVTAIVTFLVAKAGLQ